MPLALFATRRAMIPESEIDPADVLEMAFGVRPASICPACEGWRYIVRFREEDGWEQTLPCPKCNSSLGLLGVAIAMTPE